MSRKPTDTVGVTLRIRERLRWQLEVAADNNDVSLNAEMERRLQDSFEIAQTQSLIRALVGGEPVADLLGAIAKAFELGKSWQELSRETGAEAWPKGKTGAEAAYIALIIIFSALLSTPEHPLDPTLAGKVVERVHRRRREGGPLVGLMEGRSDSEAERAAQTLAWHVLEKVQTSADRKELWGLPALTRKKRGEK